MKFKYKYILLASLSLILAGCAGYNAKMIGAKNINPDINGDPSPIAISIFELSDATDFSQASFMKLYSMPEKTLGTSLLAQKNVMLRPGETLTLNLPVIKTAYYLGVVAAYRNIDTVNWQLLVPIHNRSAMGQNFTITVGENGVTLQKQGAL